MVHRVLAAGGDAHTDEAIPNGVRKRLAATTETTPHEILARRTATDGTTKTLIGLGPNREVESVVIPGRGRETLCVSSQIGCKRACTFCFTGTMGLVDELRADEIVLQLWLARAEGHAVRNVVFMGMGEPLDNFDAVRTAVAVMTDSRAFGVAPKHVTVSTVGPSPDAVDELAALPTRVAWSLHAADDAVRERLIRTHKHPVAELRDAFERVCKRRGAPLFVEVTLMKDQNDSDDHASAIVALFDDFEPEVRVNLLPMNPIDNELAPSERVDEFAAVLRTGGLFTTVRRARGDDERSACGQLRTEVSRRLRVW